MKFTLGGEELHLFENVKYLGVKLDKRVWKPRPEVTLGKDYKVFWTCRWLFSKTW